MGKKPPRVATPALAALAKAGVEYRVHAYDHDPSARSYGDEAVQHLGAAPGSVFKTLVITDGTRFGVALVPAQGRLSLKAAGAVLGLHRPVMAGSADVTRVTGYVLGGVSPLAQRRRLPTAVDASAWEFSTVFCSAGRRGLEIELAPADLVTLTGATTAPLAAE
ncbi:aminoacyl-tRNA deacylase [Tsukamurella sp. 8F]|uniref:aminoacyl-tRNA deacylase n=1 Tax=unclassified Tsukamurella TaxID=2633480 RepID=UPI0023B9E4E4|nr:MULTISPECIES: aminoacyl-tRNA deacylase [unclassified Tsukamurella]MDF0529081.1 aminoacyl-tRNA deacylase [Tsukamurella sp. 8J]MDF0587455.1 aminoacyl-tRNA deacylase [Tsukamurella sp. 8F]